ncbi:MAG TPA: ATP-binding protein, partial [Verrucomicrobiae bacterium]|nr:ATP-binding protein [Verrucomicrobiae bacterium]
MRERGPPGTSQRWEEGSHAQASQGPEVESLRAGEMAALMRTIDWSATPLGPVDGWPPSLRSALDLCLGSPVPMMIWWGPELVALYNDAYRPILGSRKHPRALGRPGREVWSDTWNVIGPMLEGALWRGQATFCDDLLLPLDRHGYREECYFTLSFNPVRDEAGRVRGVFTTAAETTQRVLGERRLRTLRDLALSWVEARTTGHACESAVRTLAANPGDIPFALLYLLEADGKSARLAGTTGVAPDMLPLDVTLADTESRSPTWPLAQVARTGRAALMSDLGARFDALPMSLWGDVPRSGLVLPVARVGPGDLYGFLVLGISPHRVLDDDYRAFLALVAEHLALTIADARAAEKERRGAEASAALDRQRAAMLARERAARADTERARRRFHDLVQGLDAVVWEANPRTARFTFVSQRAEQLLGYPVERWTSEPQFWLSLLHPEDRERTIGLCRRAIDEGRDQEVEYRLVAANGTTVWMHDTIQVVRDRRGRMRKLRGFMTDVSDRKRTEEERVRLLADMEHARRQAEVANRVKDEFLATLSHELRTPLGAILLWVRLLRGTPLDQATTARALAMIEQDAKALERIVGDILDVSRIITGKLGLQVGVVDLGPTIQAAIESLRPAADARSIHIECTLDRSATSISGDEARLRQVVWNLLSNAIKFTPKGGRIDIRLERAGSAAQITVKDTGRGIEPDFLPHVFERFLQADSSTTRAHGGLGLGLAIVRHLVELHGGSVHAESPGEGGGATFAVRLPLLPVRPPEASGKSRQPAGASAPTLEGVRVLLVEDDLNTRESLGILLRQRGARVTATESAAEGFRALEREPPDVLVSDLGMPHEDGFSLIRKVRALGQERGCRVPAVALTGYANPETRARALSEGYDVHLPKPADPEELT